MMVDPLLSDEIEALRIVVETMGDTATTQDELDVVAILAGLLLRLERHSAETEGALH